MWAKSAASAPSLPKRSLTGATAAFTSTAARPWKLITQRPSNAWPPISCAPASPRHGSVTSPAAGRSTIGPPKPWLDPWTPWIGSPRWSPTSRSGFIYNCCVGRLGCALEFSDNIHRFTGADIGDGVLWIRPSSSVTMTSTEPFFCWRKDFNNSLWRACRFFPCTLNFVRRPNDLLAICGGVARRFALVGRAFVQSQHGLIRGFPG